MVSLQPLKVLLGLNTVIYVQYIAYSICSLNGSYYCLMDSQVVEFYGQIVLFNEVTQNLRTVKLTDGKS